MQLRKAPALVFYIGSYLPLSLILMVQDAAPDVFRRPLCGAHTLVAGRCRFHWPVQHPAWAFGTVAITLVCFVLTIAFLKTIGLPRRVVIIESKHIPADLINYTIPYIVSFMGLDFTSADKLVGFGVFFIWLFWITFCSGQIMMNPVLSAFGWRLYEIKYRYLQSDDVFTGRALSGIEVDPNASYRMGRVQDMMILGEK